MGKPRNPEGQRYEAVFELPPGDVRRELRRRLRDRMDTLVSLAASAYDANDRGLLNALEYSCRQVRELHDQLRGNIPYTWNMPLTPEEAAAIEREPRRKM